MSRRFWKERRKIVAIVAIETAFTCASAIERIFDIPSNKSVCFTLLRENSKHTSLKDSKRNEREKRKREKDSHTLQWGVSERKDMSSENDFSKMI